MILVNVDVAPVIQHFKDLQREDQIPEAVRRSLNMLADRFQQRMRERLEANFKLQRKTFLFNSIKITKANRATKTKWAVTIQVMYAPLAAFEEGIAHTPGSGRDTLAAQAGKLTDKIVRSSNPLSMRQLTFGPGTIQPHQTGGNRTFSMQTSKGLFILQRTGKKTTKKVYKMRSRITRPAKLHFIDTANQVMSTEYDQIFSEAIRQVIKSMRPKKG